MSQDDRDQLKRLDRDYEREGIVFSWRAGKIGVYHRGATGQPTGRALMRFANHEDAEEWVWNAILADQDGGPVRPWHR